MAGTYFALIESTDWLLRKRLAECTRSFTEVRAM
jgi:hypothetical protein